ncbi:MULTISPECIES: acyl-CoA dehydrogenase [unclassified Roseovarius]|uniref:acyl-CoA dehydrogenase n=1 Tax=unclassified Roseovarius TaxID=2614913 RepID=UPI00273D66B1|nr:acyl-CoA dehydrogenase [Roseovarius sp. MMSF_3350]
MTTFAPLNQLPPSHAREPVPPDVAQALHAAAADEERGKRPISRSIDLLRQAGLLRDDGATDPARTARALMQVGAANLSVGRLWEGHVNALYLIRLHGSEAQKRDAVHRIADGALLGVWGADGNVPVTLDAAAKRLDGNKHYASGLGTVTRALVTVNSGPEVRLALVDVTDAARADPSTWNMQGMCSTASGGYDFTGVPADEVEWIGGPGDYLKEPHFVGGVWRIAALQAGATVGLLDRAASKLRAAERMDAEAQKARLMDVLMRAWAGMAMTERAAAASADHFVAQDDIVATSIAARLYTEEVGLDAIRAVEQSIGLQHFEVGSETGRMARDLSVYLRQVARDAFLQRAAQTALGNDGRIWGVFG